MKTKLFFLGLIATLSLSASAGTFLRTESGQASWIVNVKDKNGSIKVFTNSQGYNASGLDGSEMQRVTWLPISFSRSAELPSKFELSDERSQETVEALIVKLMNAELAGQPVKVLDSKVVLHNVTCQEQGFFKKQLLCSSSYSGNLSVEFSK